MERGENMSGYPYPEFASKSQRKWIKKRDMGVCQMPKFYLPGSKVFWHTCGREGEEIHHIWPKRALLYLTGENPHTETNLILLCRYHHWKIHPDIAEALRARKVVGKEEALKEMFESRIRLLADGKPYWTTTWDAYLKQIALLRTKQYMSMYPTEVFPLTHGVGQTALAF